MGRLWRRAPSPQESGFPIRLAQRVDDEIRRLKVARVDCRTIIDETGTVFLYVMDRGQRLAVKIERDFPDTAPVILLDPPLTDGRTSISARDVIQWNSRSTVSEVVQAIRRFSTGASRGDIEPREEIIPRDEHERALFYWVAQQARELRGHGFQTRLKIGPSREVSFLIATGAGSLVCVATGKASPPELSCHLVTYGPLDGEGSHRQAVELQDLLESNGSDLSRLAGSVERTYGNSAGKASSPVEFASDESEGSSRAVISHSAQQTITAEARQSAPLESAGLLLGTASGGLWRVMEATGPGRNVSRSGGHVSPDVGFLNDQIRQAERRGLEFLGEWHSHPAYLDHPSGGDDATIARLMGKNRLSHFLAGIVVERAGSLRLNFFGYDSAGIRRTIDSVELPGREEAPTIPTPTRRSDRGYRIATDNLLLQRHFDSVAQRMVGGNDEFRVLGNGIEYRITIPKTYPSAAPQIEWRWAREGSSHFDHLPASLALARWSPSEQLASILLTVSKQLLVHESNTRADRNPTTKYQSASTNLSAEEVAAHFESFSSESERMLLPDPPILGRSGGELLISRRLDSETDAVLHLPPSVASRSVPVLYLRSRVTGESIPETWPGSGGFPWSDPEALHYLFDDLLLDNVPSAFGNQVRTVRTNGIHCHVLGEETRLVLRCRLADAGGHVLVISVDEGAEGPQLIETVEAYTIPGSSFRVERGGTLSDGRRPGMSSFVWQFIEEGRERIREVK